MSKSLEELALKKQLLQARSALYRLKIHQQVRQVGGKLKWVSFGAKVVTSFPLGSGLLGLALKSVYPSRVARLVSLGTRIVLILRITNAVAKLLHSLPMYNSGKRGAQMELPQLENRN